MSCGRRPITRARMRGKLEGGDGGVWWHLLTPLGR
jgi:hypothetical protein